MYVAYNEMASGRRISFSLRCGESWRNDIKAKKLFAENENEAVVLERVEKWC